MHLPPPARGKGWEGGASRAEPSQNRPPDAGALRLSGSDPRERGRGPAPVPQAARAATCNPLPPMWGRDGEGGPPQAEPSQNRRADAGALRLSGSDPGDQGRGPGRRTVGLRAAKAPVLAPARAGKADGAQPAAPFPALRRDGGRMTPPLPPAPHPAPLPTRGRGGTVGPLVAKAAAGASLPLPGGRDGEGGPPRAKPSRDPAQDGRPDV
jgi:hypothetical protein